MIHWIDLAWCVGALLMAYSAALKLRAGSQSKGAVVVILLCIGQIVAVFIGQETLAYIASTATVVIAVLLVAIDLRWNVNDV